MRTSILPHFYSFACLLISTSGLKVKPMVHFLGGEGNLGLLDDAVAAEILRGPAPDTQSKRVSRTRVKTQRRCCANSGKTRGSAEAETFYGDLENGMSISEERRFFPPPTIAHRESLGPGSLLPDPR